MNTFYDLLISKRRFVLPMVIFSSSPRNVHQQTCTIGSHSQIWVCKCKSFPCSQSEYIQCILNIIYIYLYTCMHVYYISLFHKFHILCTSSAPGTWSNQTVFFSPHRLIALPSQHGPSRSLAGKFPLVIVNGLAVMTSCRVTVGVPMIAFGGARWAPMIVR